MTIYDQKNHDREEPDAARPPVATVGAMDISIDDFVRFCGRTIGGMHRALDRLDDTTVNTAPDLTGANTPFQLTTHALAATEWWTAHIVCGRPSDRIRADEFASSGTVGELHRRADDLVALLHDLAPELRAATDLAHPAHTRVPPDGDWTVGAALLHAYEELAQHLGHLEITVDIVTTR